MTSPATPPTATLLATLLGGRPAVREARARALLERWRHPAAIAERGERELRSLGLTARDVERLRAAVALGRRLSEALEHPPRIASPVEAFALVRPLLAGQMRERFVVLALDVKHRPLEVTLVAEGSVDSCAVDAREVFAPALRERASALILAHNHPSGDPEPSREDLALTRRLVEIGRLVGVPVVDHLVVGEGRRAYVSLAEARLLPPGLDGAQVDRAAARKGARR